jgi:hypothetical protein
MHPVARHLATLECMDDTEGLPVARSFVRRLPDGWWVYLGGWEKIPENMIAKGYNPTGRVIVWVTRTGGIVCYSVPTEI